MKKFFTFIAALAAALSAGAEHLPLTGTATKSVPSSQPLEVSFSDAWGIGVVLTGDLTFKRTDYPKIRIKLSGIGDEAKPMGINVKYDGASDKTVTTASKDGDNTYDLPTDVDANTTINQLLFRSRDKENGKGATIEYFALIDADGVEHTTTYKVSSPASPTYYSANVTFSGIWQNIGEWTPAGLAEGDKAIYSIFLGEPYNSTNLQMVYNVESSQYNYLTLNADYKDINVIYYTADKAGASKVRLQSTSADAASINIQAIYYNLNKVEVVIPSSGLTTFVYPQPLDLTNLPDGLTAYYATANTGTSITMSPATTAITANNPILLKGTPGEHYAIPLAANGSALSGNKLKRDIGSGEDWKATTGGKVITISADDSRYILSGGQFHRLSQVAKMPPYKAYLQAAAPAGARLSIEFEDGVTTGIRSVENGHSAADTYFDLQGRRVAQPTKGLYIVNGKKVIMK